MALGQRRNRVMVPQAQAALDSFKYEVARDLNVQPPPSGYWGNLTSRDCGAVGGQMVRRMIEMAERSLAGTAGMQAGPAGGAAGGFAQGRTR
ncbi:MAG: alpha/beta-type small acid-soluble spore protein [Bacillota bacterium]